MWSRSVSWMKSTLMWPSGESSRMRMRAGRPSWVRVVIGVAPDGRMRSRRDVVAVGELDEIDVDVALGRIVEDADARRKAELGACGNRRSPRRADAEQAGCGRGR